MASASYRFLSPGRSDAHDTVRHYRDGPRHDQWTWLHFHAVPLLPGLQPLQADNLPPLVDRGQHRREPAGHQPARLAGSAPQLLSPEDREPQRRCLRVRNPVVSPAPPPSHLHRWPPTTFLWSRTRPLMAALPAALPRLILSIG